MRFHRTPLQIQKEKTIAWLKDSESKTTIPSSLDINRKQMATLEEVIQGRIVWPWTPGYDTDKRDFNNVYPADPVVIIYVANYEDVRLILEFATEVDLPTTIRSGGHSLTDYSVCDGIVIDISGLKSVNVDTVNQTAWVEAGNTFADLNPKLEFYGMHLPGGGCPTVSVAGFMQGGGYGLTSRNFGIQSDIVLEFTMMLADGSLVIANADQNSDLFWAVRGGTGGNFGVLLNITYKIFPLGEIWGLQLAWDFETDTTNAAGALVAIQDNYLSGFNHPELGIEILVYTDIATDNHKKVVFAAGFIGSETELDAAIAPLMAVPGATRKLKKQGKYSEVNNWVLEGIPDVPHDVKFYGRSAYVARSLTVEDYADILTQFKTAPNDYAMIDLEGYGGVINQYPVENSAFIHRDVLMDFYTILFFDNASNDQEQNREWMIQFYAFLEQYTNGHSYQNYPNRDQTNFQWAYWGPYYNQLVSIKQKYDPNNFFHYPQSIGVPVPAEYENKQIMLFDNTAIVYEKH